MFRLKHLVVSFIDENLNKEFAEIEVRPTQERPPELWTFAVFLNFWEIWKGRAGYWIIYSICADP